MYSSRIIPLLMVALSATTVTHAAFMDVELFGGVHHEGAVKRQTNLLTSLLSTDALTTPTAAASSPSTTEEPTTSSTEDAVTTEPSSTTEAPTTTDAPSPTSEPTTTQDPTTAPTTDPTTTTDGQTTTTEASPTTGPTTTNGPTSTTTNAGGAGGSSDTSTTAEPTTTSAPSTTLSSYTSVVTEVTVITTRDESGQTSTTRTSTGASLVTSQPDTPNSNPRMAQGTRNIIVGVTVGVGGAIVLGVAGLLFWRLRNKRRNNEESEDLVSYGNGFGGPGTAEKSEAPTNPGGRSPFQSTLESYHAPTQTNAASNF
ncbi:hypothetical protein SLS62_007618 [Diatrype stigma]|uniref:Mid2 domain-containing protein n=1 Tax=Diatrype stigma TaxID=117547 RepID=A0AAN9UL35_9PEZI